MPKTIKNLSIKKYFKMMKKFMETETLYHPRQEELLKFLGVSGANKHQSGEFLNPQNTKWMNTLTKCIEFMKKPAIGLMSFHKSSSESNYYFIDFEQNDDLSKRYKEWKEDLTTDESALFQCTLEIFENFNSIEHSKVITSKTTTNTYKLNRWDYLILLYPLSVIITCSQTGFSGRGNYTEKQILDAYCQYYQFFFGNLPDLNYLSIDRLKSTLGDLTLNPDWSELDGSVKKLTHYSPEPSLFSENTRNDEIAQISGILSSSNLVILFGEAGMGKSELAKIYAKSMGDHYKAIQFISAENGIKEAVISIRFKETLTKEIKSPDDATEIFQRNMKYTYDLDNTNLIIFDNLDYPTAVDIQGLIELTGAEAKIIVTSRHNFKGHDHLKSLLVTPLQETIAIDLFYSYYTNGIPSKSHDECDLMKLLEEVGYNTLFIKLIASTLQHNIITISELREAFESFDGDNDIWIDIEHYTGRMGIESVNRDMLGHLKVIFNMSKVNEDPNNILIMQAMALIPHFGIDKKSFYKIFFDKKIDSKTFINAINELSRNGWLEIESGNLRLHPAISYMMIADESLRPAALNFHDENNIAFCLYQHIHPIILQINNFQYFNGETYDINEQTSSAVQSINTALFMIPRIFCYEKELFTFLCQIATSCRLFDMLEESQRITQLISRIAESSDFEITDDMAIMATTAYFDAAMFYTFIDEYKEGEKFLLQDNLPSYVKKGIEISPLLHSKWVDNLIWCVFNQEKNYENCQKSLTAYANEISLLYSSPSPDQKLKEAIASLYYNIGTVLSSPVMKLREDRESIKLFAFLAGLQNDYIFHITPQNRNECYNVAEMYLQESIKILTECYTEENVGNECTRELNQIAFICMCRGKIAIENAEKENHIREAIAIYLKVLEVRMVKFGNLSHYIVTQYMNLGNAHRELYQCTKTQQDYKSAISYYEKALEIQKSIYGENTRYQRMYKIIDDLRTNKK